MPHTSYPTENDLINRLTGAGIDADVIEVLKDMGTIGDAVAAAASEWENATGWKPYLAAGETTKYFDPPTLLSGGLTIPGRRLTLPVPLLSLTAIRVNGQLYRNGTGFTLGPANAGTADEPWLWVIFQTAVGGNAGDIAITGKWGKVAAIPDNVWDAILQQASTILAPDLALAVSEGVTEKKVGDVTTRFVGTGGAGQVDLQARLRENRWNRLVNDNKRRA